MSALRQLPLLLALLAPALCTAGGADSYVLLLRHCPATPRYCERSSFTADPLMSCLSNFAADTLPGPSDWGAEEGQCTPSGIKNTADLGAAMRPLLGMGQEGEAPIRVITSGGERFMTTAKSLALSASEVEVDQALFDPIKLGKAKCNDFNRSAALERQVGLMSKELATVRNQLHDLQAILGPGSAPPIDETPDVVDNGRYVGGLLAASAMVETFLMEKAAAIPVAWGLLSDEALVEFQRIQTTYFRAAFGDKEIAQRHASGILNLINNLFQQVEPTTTVLVGHNLNIEALRALLGVRFQCAHWADNSTMPLSGLLFQRSSSEVSVQAVCHTFGLGEGELVKTGPATFTNGKSALKLEAFTKRATAATLPPCTAGSKKLRGSETP